MTTPRAAVRYRCPCGAEYLVATQEHGADSNWLENVRIAAGRLGLGVVDGSQQTFVCSSCGRTHANGEGAG
jgi:hypothetical protein